MKEIYYVYNNEAIASCIFLAILNKIDMLDIARSCLVLPFLFDDRTVSYLSKNPDTELDNMIKEQSRLFASFNKRYLSLLPVTINSLTLLNTSNQISIGNEIVANVILDFENKILGNRFDRILEVIPIFLSLIEKHSTTQLYKILKVQL
ncbi:three component ABC system middle component [uncultured Chryseobacterium sp.]|uniref:three component ABC system middle component n=1 Tax=Chryseobacterium sp. sg2396 TaxID=3276280 RepID=UPI00258FD52B|nr:three component ABC system middle component [uncultured Chryseobacterium sp.]